MSARAAYLRRAADRIAERHRERTTGAAALDRVILDELVKVWRSFLTEPPKLTGDQP